MMVTPPVPPVPLVLKNAYGLQPIHSIYMRHLLQPVIPRVIPTTWDVVEYIHVIRRAPLSIATCAMTGTALYAAVTMKVVVLTLYVRVPLH